MIFRHPLRDPSGDGFTLPAALFRESSEKPATVSSTLVKDQDEPEEKDEKILLCKKCSAGIAKEIDRIGREGKHLHTFFNPAGVVYEIGCFRQASGCYIGGPRSNEFPWFAGYSWQISFCASCSEHLGWFFSSSEDTFFGLIVNRLRES
jgi:hypothetical protein